MRTKGYAGLLVFVLGACLVSYAFAAAGYILPGALLPGQIFVDGFESGDLSAWLVDGTSAIVSSPTHHGSYSALTPNCLSWITKNFASDYADCYIRFYVRFPAMPPYSVGNAFSFLVMYDAGWTEFVYAGLRTTYTGAHGWALYSPGGGGWIFSDTTINVDQWYCIEVRRKVGAGNGIAQMWVDGTLILSLTSETLATNCKSIGVGWFYANAALGTFAGYFDCVVVADAYIGPESSITTVTSQTTATTATSATSATTATTGTTYVILSVSGQGSVNLAPGVYTYPTGTVVSIYIVSGSLSYWTLDGTSMGTQPINFIMNINHQITIVFSGGTTTPNALNINYLVIGAVLMIGGGGLAYDDHIKEQFESPSKPQKKRR